MIEPAVRDRADEPAQLELDLRDAADDPWAAFVAYRDNTPEYDPDEAPLPF